MEPRSETVNSRASDRSGCEQSIKWNIVTGILNQRLLTHLGQVLSASRSLNWRCLKHISNVILWFDSDQKSPIQQTTVVSACEQCEMCPENIGGFEDDLEVKKLFYT
jgi:hypothetical protein